MSLTTATVATDEMIVVLRRSDDQASGKPPAARFQGRGHVGFHPDIRGKENKRII